MKKRKLIILSLDAMITEDLEHLKDKPFVQKLMKDGVWIKSLRTVFPSNTYPCHSSMITGFYPCNTGVDTNYYDGTTTWRAERSNIKVKTLIDYAKENGYTTANVFWPVLGGDPNIDYNIPEYFPSNDKLISVLKEHGTSDEVIENIVKPNMEILTGGNAEREPYAGRFLFACAKDMILKYQPDVLLIHPCPLDTYRHKDGVFSDRITEALEESYEHVVELYDAVKQIGEEDNTDFVWMSDHGQMTIESWYRFMVEMKNKGFINVDDNGDMIDSPVEFTVFNTSVMLKIKDESIRDAVYNHLKEEENAKKGIKIYTKKEVNELFHTDGDFDLMIDSDGVYGLGREAYPDELGNVYSTAAPGVIKKIGTHGQSPDVGFQPTFIAIGPDFKAGVTLDRVETVNVPVTLAKCLGLTLEGADGKVIEEILK